MRRRKTKERGKEGENQRRGEVGGKQEKWGEKEDRDAGEG